MKKVCGICNPASAFCLKCRKIVQPNAENHGEGMTEAWGVKRQDNFWLAVCPICGGHEFASVDDENEAVEIDVD